MTLEEVMASLMVAYALAVVGGVIAYHVIVKIKKRRN